MKINGVLIKSDNALYAENDGRFTLSELCKRLRIPTEIEASLPWDGEWHHVSAFANRVPYYCLTEVSTWLKTPVGEEALAKAKALKKSKNDRALEKVIPVARVTWWERETIWKNGRPRGGDDRKVGTKAVEVRIHPKKILATVVLADGSTFKKAASKLTLWDANGIEINTAA